ncbi:hypothetical protein ADUPG1_004633, partial [Aduncisulcus paluster]
VAAPWGAAIGLGVELAAKLCDAGYEVPNLEELLAKRDQLVGLPNIKVVREENGVLQLIEEGEE